MDTVISNIKPRVYNNNYTSLKELFVDYRATKRCLPSFNVNDNYDLKAVVEAAEEMDTNVMVMTYPPVAELNTPEVFRALVDGFKKISKNNIYLHLDHSTSVEQCKHAIDAGYDSVMIDGSQVSLKENIKMTKAVVDYAKPRGVVVEAEIGKIMGRGVEVKSDNDFLADLEEVVRLYEETNVDIMAVGIGTAHGFTPTEPKIHFDRLQEIADAIPIPLVLHGGTGIPDADIQKSIKIGMSKINIGTIVHTTYMKHAFEEIQKAGDSAYPPFIMKEVLPKIKEVVKDRLRAVNF
ncbi:class II fructose-bisphosphate aldolase [Seonamhaeicola maritimus]|uniref:Class II fructose-bisphosphate aldolase n=1 Tax=Seonamhaeicola maritimus TaxID=2591822 RepID=A0A5C7GL34_9FLAO|nr:class II fructose-bisphosphate aldolase [Seonamhaeicola maritimus]TXG38837.1 class II fructose-bisphosphate aldolase [Seonamhaeicola maritimus]